MDTLKTLLAGAAAAMLLPATAGADPETIAAAFDMQKCVNIGNTLEAPREGEWGPPATSADFINIKNAGFDTVRIPVRWSNGMGDGPDYRIDEAYMQRVEYLVNAALARDLNVILNVHHFDGIFEEPEAHFAAFEAVWDQIAARFEGSSDNLWFETLNEPHNNLSGDLTRQSQQIAIDAIRPAHPDRIIILGGDEWSNWRQLDTNLVTDDPNIVYTFHYYEPFEFTHYDASWVDDMENKRSEWGTDTDEIELTVAAVNVWDYQMKVNRPVFMGEFGAYTTLPQDQRVKWAAAVRQEFEEYDIPWCLWAYSNTFPIYDKDTGQWDEEMLEALGL